MDVPGSDGAAEESPSGKSPRVHLGIASGPKSLTDYYKNLFKDGLHARSLEAMYISNQKHNLGIEWYDRPSDAGAEVTRPVANTLQLIYDRANWYDGMSRWHSISLWFAGHGGMVIIGFTVLMVNGIYAPQGLIFLIAGTVELLSRSGAAVLTANYRTAVAGEIFREGSNGRYRVVVPVERSLAGLLSAATVHGKQQRMVGRTVSFLSLILSLFATVTGADSGLAVVVILEIISIEISFPTGRAWGAIPLLSVIGMVAMYHARYRRKKVVHSIQGRFPLVGDDGFWNEYVMTIPVTSAEAFAARGNEGRGRCGVIRGATGQKVKFQATLSQGVVHNTIRFVHEVADCTSGGDLESAGQSLVFISDGSKAHTVGGRLRPRNVKSI